MECGLIISRELVVSAIEQIPFFHFEENSTENPFGGIGFKLLEIFATKLNFTYRVVRPPDEVYGSEDPQTGRWTGLVGMIARNEADMVVTDLSVSSDRAEVVDFSQPYFLDPVAFIVKLKPPSRDIALLSIFPTEMLVAAMLFIVLMCFSSRAATWARGYHRETFTKTLIVTLGSLLRQAFPRAPKSVYPSNWIMYPAWWFVVLHTTILFSSVLFSFLNLTIRPEAIQTVDQLLDSAGHGHIQVGTLKGSLVLDIFTQEDHYRRLSINSDPPRTQMPDVGTGLKLVQESYNYAVCYPKFLLLSASVSFPRNTLSISRDHFFLMHYAVALQKGSCLKRGINRMISSILEAGLIWKISNEELHYNPLIFKKNKPKTVTFCPLTLVNLFLAKYLLGYGILVATVTFLVEIIYMFWFPKSWSEMFIEFIKNMWIRRWWAISHSSLKTVVINKSVWALARGPFDNIAPNKFNSC